jgi:hypothetical protein
MKLIEQGNRRYKYAEPNTVDISIDNARLLLTITICNLILSGVPDLSPDAPENCRFIVSPIREK